MAEKGFGEVFRDCLSCKCGEERHDVQYGQTRLALMFVTINLVAASLGLNLIASETEGKTTTVLGRGAFTETTTLTKIDINNRTADVDAELSLEYDFDNKDTCDAVSGISSKDCEEMIVATNVFISMGVLATVTFAIIFTLLLRIECRQLCSRPMRQVLIGLLSVGWIFTFVGWLIIVASPVPDNFDSLGSSFWIMLLASISSLVCIVVSILDYRGAGGGPAPAAKYN